MELYNWIVKVFNIQQVDRRVTVTIANNAAVSGSFDPQGARGLAVLTPGAWTAANIGLEVSTDGGTTWIPVRTEWGSLVMVSGVVTNAAASYILPPSAWQVGLYPQARLTSLNTSTYAAVNQGGARTLVVALLM